MRRRRLDRLRAADLIAGGLALSAALFAATFLLPCAIWNWLLYVAAVAYAVFAVYVTEKHLGLGRIGRKAAEYATFGAMMVVIAIGTLVFC